MKIGFLGLLSCAAFAQTTQTPSEAKPAVIEGKVVNSITGEQIRKAELTLTTSLMPDGFEAMAKQFGMDDDVIDSLPAAAGPKKTFTATTDAAGKFKFDKVDPGDYYFTAKHSGFMDETYKPTGKDLVAGRLHLAAGRELSDVEFRLVPQGAVSGKVVDEDGDPVADAMVTASKYSYYSGHRTLQLTDTGTTNDRGEFRLSKLPPGRYYLNADSIAAAAAAMGSVPPPPKDDAPEIGYVATYFPKTTDVQDAEVVEVKPAGDVPGFVIHLQEARVVRVKGALAGADGKPLKSARIMLMSSAHPGSMRMTMSNSEGKFEMANVPPGVYMAMVMQMTGPTPSMIMQPLIVPAENLSGVKLGTAPSGTLPGRVIVTGDGKVQLKGTRVTLAGEDNAPFMPSSAAVDESGAFTLTKVATVPYGLSLHEPDGTYLKSVLWNGHENLGKTIDLTNGTAGDLQVILGTDGGSLDAAVTHDDKPVTSATVVLLPEDPGRRFTETTHDEQTDEKGHAAFKDVGPGNYLLVAWEKVEEGAWFDPEFMKAAGSSAVKVSIDPKGNQRVDIKVIPAAK